MSTYSFTNTDVIEAKRGDERAKLKVLEGMQPKIRATAHRARSSVAEVDDLYQAGAMGVLEAIQSFDPNRGVPFPAYASPLIRSAVAEALSAAVPGPSMPHDLRARISLLAEQGIEGNEAVEALSEKRYYHGAAALDAHHRTGYIEAPFSGSEDEDFVSDDFGLVSQDLVGASTVNLTVRDAVAELPEREREILTLAYGLDGGPELNDREIGETIDLDRSRVNRIRNRAELRLRRMIEGEAQ